MGKIVLVLLGIVVLAGGYLIFRNSTNYRAASPQQPTSSDSPASQTAASSSITIQGFAFSPVKLTVKPGESVSILNQDATDHTVTADDKASFDSQAIKANTAGTITAPAKSGTYKFHCSFHPTMTGTLIVQ